MKHVLIPKKAYQIKGIKKREASQASLGGFFYDYLSSPDDKIVGLRYWIMDRVCFDTHPVYSQFVDDSRFKFDDARKFVDIVFDERDAELL